MSLLRSMCGNNVSPQIRFGQHENQKHQGERKGNVWLLGSNSGITLHVFSHQRCWGGCGVGFSRNAFRELTESHRISLGVDLVYRLRAQIQADKWGSRGSTGTAAWMVEHVRVTAYTDCVGIYPPTHTHTHSHPPPPLVLRLVRLLLWEVFCRKGALIHLQVRKELLWPSTQKWWQICHVNS